MGILYLIFLIVGCIVVYFIIGLADLILFSMLSQEFKSWFREEEEFYAGLIFWPVPTIVFLLKYCVLLLGKFFTSLRTIFTKFTSA
jgi:hypothetical protein